VLQTSKVAGSDVHGCGRGKRWGRRRGQGGHGRRGRLHTMAPGEWQRGRRRQASATTASFSVAPGKPASAEEALTRRSSGVESSSSPLHVLYPGGLITPHVCRSLAVSPVVAPWTGWRRSSRWWEWWICELEGERVWPDGGSACGRSEVAGEASASTVPRVRKWASAATFAPIMRCPGATPPTSSGDIGGWESGWRLIHRRKWRRRATHEGSTVWAAAQRQPSRGANRWWRRWRYALGFWVEVEVRAIAGGWARVWVEAWRGAGMMRGWWGMGRRASGVLGGGDRGARAGSRRTRGAGEVNVCSPGRKVRPEKILHFVLFRSREGSENHDFFHMLWGLGYNIHVHVLTYVCVK
jgi:hypothetical protein